MNGDVLARCVETLAARHRAVLETPGVKYDRHRARIARFRRLDRVFGRFATLGALGDAATGRTLATCGGLALGDHSSAPLARMLADHGFDAPRIRPLDRAPFGQALAVLRQAIEETERRPAEDRALARFALRELMSRALPLLADGMADVGAALSVDDFSADRLALLFAASELGRPVALALMAAGSRPAPPVPVAVAFCADEAQAADYPAARRVMRPGAAPLPEPKSPKPRYDVGIVFNGKTDDAQIRAAHAALTRHPRVGAVGLRLHPAFRPEAPLDGLGVAQDGTLAEFARAFDVVVCGNSGSLIELARLGAVVLFSDRIDHNPRDRHGFLARGLIFEDDRPLDAVDFDAAVAFHASPAWRDRLAAAYPPETRAAFEARDAALQALAGARVSPA